MAQISLPDTAVVDLTVLQTIVNAINRHDSVLTQIASSYGSVPKTANVNEDTGGAFNSVFNLTSHEIEFGKEDVPSASVITDGSNAAASGKQITISFERAFAVAPIVLATVRADYDYFVEVQSTTTTNFKVSVRGTTAHTGAWVNWIAIGSKVG